MKLINSIRNSRFIRNASVLASGSILAQAITSLSYLAITRIFLPDELGEFSFFQSTAIILSIIGTATFEQVIIIPKKDDEGQKVLQLCIHLLLGFSFLLFIVSLLFGPFLSIKTDYSKPFFVLIALGAFLIGSINSISYWMIRKESIKTLSTSKVMQAGVTSIFQFALGLLSKLQFSMIYGFLIGRAFTLYFVIKKTSFNFKLLTKIKFRELINRYSKQPKYYLPSRFLSQAANESPVLLIGLLFDSLLLGFYSLAYRVITVPSSFIGVSVGLVFFKEINSQVIEKKPILSTLLKTWLTLIAIGIIPLSLLFFKGEQLFTVVFGNSWSLAGTIASIYSPVILLKFATAPTEKALIVLDKQKVVSLFSLLDFLLRSAAILIGYYFFDFLTSIYFIAFFHLLFTISLNGYLVAVSNYHDKTLLKNE